MEGLLIQIYVIKSDKIIYFILNLEPFFQDNFFTD